MILFRKITLTILASEAKGYNWETCDCSNCDRRMWGHGFVTRYFSGYSNPFFLKRYRCPDCKIVVTTRPDEFWERIRSSIKQIYECLVRKLTSGRWPPDTSRQRAGHWLRRFNNHAKMSIESDYLNFLKMCYEKNLNFFT
jgi:hypothetical protein